MAVFEINSTLIDAIEYDEAVGKLVVFLYNGQRREHVDVPMGVVLGLKLSFSPGEYYMSQIRKNYPDSDPLRPWGEDATV